MIQGGLGIAASGNRHPGKISMFEPTHGSAPKYRGKNVANPLAAINAGGMKLDYLGEKEAARKVDHAIASLLTSGRIKSLSAGVHATSEIGDMVTAEVRKLEKRWAHPDREHLVRCGTLLQSSYQRSRKEFSR